MFAGRGIYDSIITWDQVKELNDRGIAFSVTLTNHFYDKESVQESFKLIETLLSTSEKNSVVVLNRAYAKLEQHFQTSISNRVQ